MSGFLQMDQATPLSPPGHRVNHGHFSHFPSFRSHEMIEIEFKLMEVNLMRSLPC